MTKFLKNGKDIERSFDLCLQTNHSFQRKSCKQQQCSLSLHKVMFKWMLPLYGSWKTRFFVFLLSFLNWKQVRNLQIRRWFMTNDTNVKTIVSSKLSSGVASPYLRVSFFSPCRHKLLCEYGKPHKTLRGRERKKHLDWCLVSESHRFTSSEQTWLKSLHESSYD